jgi:hypothetical protein
VIERDGTPLIEINMRRPLKEAVLVPGTPYCVVHAGESVCLIDTERMTLAPLAQGVVGLIPTELNIFQDDSIRLGRIVGRMRDAPATP